MTTSTTHLIPAPRQPDTSPAAALVEAEAIGPDTCQVHLDLTPLRAAIRVALREEALRRNALVAGGRRDPGVGRLIVSIPAELAEQYVAAFDHLQLPGLCPIRNCPSFDGHCRDHTAGARDDIGSDR